MYIFNLIKGVTDDKLTYLKLFTIRPSQIFLSYNSHTIEFKNHVPNNYDGVCCCELN